jgi:clan AA aspartic protease (TIGR02281 family)
MRFIFYCYIVQRFVLQCNSMRIFKACGVFFIAFIFFQTSVYPDTIYFRHGGSLEGIIKSDDAQNVELEVAFGTIKFGKAQVDKIERSTDEELDSIRQRWEAQREETKRQSQIQEQEQALQPKAIEFSKEQSGLMVNAVLNKTIDVSLVLDTGASLVLLTKDVGKRLGMDLDDQKNIIQLHLADGRKTDAKYVILESVSVQHIEAEKVPAAILLEDIDKKGFRDGLLGMSFLSRFNFKIDHEKGQVILEKLK